MSRTLSQFQHLQNTSGSLNQHPHYSQQSNLDEESSYFDDDSSMEQSSGRGKSNMMDQFLHRLQDEDFLYEDTDMDMDPASQFATVANFQSSLSTINARLLTQNLIQQPLSFETSQSQVQILNLIYRLLIKRQEDVEFRENLADQMSRLQCDNKNLKSNLQRTRNDLESEKRQLVQERIKFKNQQTELRKEIKMLSKESEKAKLLNQNMLQKQVQYEHKLHRQEIENNKLKDRVQKLVEAKSGLPNRMDIVNVVPKKDGRSTWKHGGKQNEDSLYQNIVGAFQDEKQEIVQENSAIRQSLRNLTFEIHQLRNIVFARIGHESQEHFDELNDAQFELPFEIVQDEIEGAIHDKIQEIHTLLSDMNSIESVSIHLNHLQTIIVSEIPTVQVAAKAKQLLQKIRDSFMRNEKIIQEQTIMLQCDSKNQSLEQQKTDYFRSPLENMDPNINGVLEEERELLNERRRTLDQRQLELEKQAMELDKQALKLAQEQKETKAKEGDSSLMTDDEEYNTSKGVYYHYDKENYSHHEI